MIVVLADDFSGAAEIAGIGFAFGLETRLQTHFQVDTSADLVVIDLATRSLSRSAAILKVTECCFQLKSSEVPDLVIFKKIDSVVRGHVLAESQVIQELLGYRRVLVGPANPRKGRIIRNGIYYVNEKPVSESGFAADPEFPLTDSHLAALLGFSSTVKSSHCHLPDPALRWPDQGWISFDLTTHENLQELAAKAEVDDLMIGAAEFFEAFLSQQGWKPQDSAGFSAGSFKTLIVKGSTFQDHQQDDLLHKLGVQTINLPELADTADRDASTFPIHQMLNILENKSLLLKAGERVDLTRSELVLQMMAALVKELVDKIDPAVLHLLISGGSTASAIFSGLKINSFRVVQQIAPGVVSLEPVDHPLSRVTVKPGSYPWPDWLFIN
jgi:uncharacterized protein YgbK (DUF1537 family)